MGGEKTAEGETVPPVSPEVEDEGLDQEPFEPRRGLRLVELDEIPAASDGRCVVVALVFLDGGGALLRCGRQAQPGAALCDLHAIHLPAVPKA